MSRGWVWFVAGIGALLAGCEGLQLNFPIEVHTITQGETALLVLVENRSTHLLRVIYPVQTGMVPPSQHVVFALPQPGSHRLVVAGYRGGRGYYAQYHYVGQLDAPVFLNGHDVFQVRGRLVGYHIAVTDRMLFSPASLPPPPGAGPGTLR